MDGQTTRLGLVLLCFMVMSGCTRGLVTPQYGLQDGRLGSCAGLRGCVSSQATDPEHFIEPLTYHGTRYEARLDLIAVLRDISNAKVASVHRNYLRYEFSGIEQRGADNDLQVGVTTVDDTEFYFVMDEAVIHVRSMPRRNMPDAGENRSRVELIRSLFMEQHGSR